MIRLERVRDLRLRPSPGFPGDPDYFSAASGLVVRDDRAIVVSDDACALGAFALSGDAPGERLRIFPGRLPVDPAERKRRKPDFEALVEWDGPKSGPSLLAIPSGSKSNRTRGAFVSGEFGPNASARELDFGGLFAQLARELPGLNIEGAACAADRLYLFQRGNGAGSANAVIALDRGMLAAELATGRIGARALREIGRIDLGELAGVRLGFGDAAVDARGRLWFLASAEATDDPYLDGAYTGAILGRLDAGGTTVEARFPLPLEAKPEGLAFDPRDDQAFYLVTDADDPTAVSELFRGRFD